MLNGSYYRPDKGEPSLYDDPRQVLGDLLVDRTELESEQQVVREAAKAAARAQRAKRQWWLNSSPREEAVLATDCPSCEADSGEPCRESGKELRRRHTERVDRAMEECPSALMPPWGAGL
ncbi:hypothetical protein AB0D94_25755 [Streptomyces sp. NPDC048255]|uniref:zinc finger domain-containing protein n=1 Tax=Streptomyces sp. NPDC048255 TaxID=3154713 RepID=UPI0033F1AF37